MNNETPAPTPKRGRRNINSKGSKHPSSILTVWLISRHLPISEIGQTCPQVEEDYLRGAYVCATIFAPGMATPQPDSSAWGDYRTRQLL